MKKHLLDDTLDTLVGSHWLLNSDLLSGYWQVEVAANDREKTACIYHIIQVQDNAI